MGTIVVVGTEVKVEASAMAINIIFIVGYLLCFI
jgi:hypothetical protein